MIHEAAKTVPQNEQSIGSFSLFLVHTTLIVGFDPHATQIQVKRNKYNIFLWKVFYPYTSSGIIEGGQNKLIISDDYMKTSMNIILYLHSILPFSKGYF